MKTKSREEKNFNLINWPIGKLIFNMAAPTIVAQLITTIYNLADTFFVSSLGTSATAAVGVNSSLERTITMMATLLGAGASSYIARLLGAGKKDKADKVFSTCFLIGMGIGLIVMTLGLCFATPLVRFLGATSESEIFSMQYAQYVLLAAPFMVCQLIMNMSLRSEGSATFAMIGIGFGGILNCILDPIFIFGMELGVAGASMATAISKLVSFSILLTPYLRRKTTVFLSPKNFAVIKKDAWEVITVGSTSFFRSIFMVLSSILLNRIAGDFSTEALAALSVSNRVMMFPFAIVLGFGQGFQPVVGYNWGAERYDRVKESLRFGSIISIIGSVAMALILFLFARPIIGAFNKVENPEVYRLGMLCIRLQCLTLPVHAYVSIVNMFYAGIGAAKYAVLLSTARQGYCLLPLLFILPNIFGVEGLTACQASADFLTIFIAIPLTIKAFRIAADKYNESRLEVKEVSAK